MYNIIVDKYYETLNIVSNQRIDRSASKKLDLLCDIA